MRRVVQRGAHPAVLRLYDAAEADRTYHTGDRALLLALDEGDGTLVDATFELLAEECLRAGGHRGDEAHVEHWLAHRNDVAALEALTSKGYTVDTMEVAGSWADLPTIYRATLEALLGRRGDARRLGAPVAQLPDGRVPVLHVRRPGRRRAAGRATTGSCGTPGSGRCSPTAGR